MKIVDRKTFLELPAGTIFCKYKPCVFDEVQIKGETMGRDFTVQDLNELGADNDAELERILENARLTGSSFTLDLDCLYRDGMFDEHQLFAIWEPADVVKLIERLQQAMEETAALEAGLALGLWPA